MAVAKGNNTETDNRPLISVSGLKVQFHTEEGISTAVNGVDFTISQNITLGIVGESGCGKSVTARAIMGLVDAPGRIEAGKILFYKDDKTIDLTAIDPKGSHFRSIRGNDIAMIFQEPMTSLNPVFTIGDQIVEAIRLHQNLTKRQAIEKSVAMLAAVGISMPRQRANEYPHQLSGGMRQRAMIAMALSCNPSLLIADEPTTALDVTIQAQVMDLMDDLRRDFNAAIMLITHDLGVVASMADEVIVMYLGKIVECAPVRDIYHTPLHPYTKGLMESIPSLNDIRRERLKTIEGTVPSSLSEIHGCGFAPRCPHVLDQCQKMVPALRDVESRHAVACFLHHSETETGHNG